ncbi:hypothetical protein DUNSADRAFT_15130 [Dunaliella salina]|uniref:Uncharacterized protein n=1 Tax=Dunaliella salina TaxID=3046 RepID=A0ABQ7H238_DUNSA|nr:hypothetical protein DUNSADRAFT_15130 [Dunaliella salina]|eukprot:KAF5840929.1 hypothetical protein DUNSADRAFT_15130 [Dunaliella salina]
MVANDASCNPFLVFPSHKATLRHLVFKYSAGYFHEPYSETAKIPVDRALLAMLSPPHPEQRARVRACLHGLEELHLGVSGMCFLNPESEPTATELGGLLGAHAPMLKRLYISRSHSACILRALPSPERLVELDVSGGIDKLDFEEIIRFTHLEKLRLRMVRDVPACQGALPKLIRLRVLDVLDLQLLCYPGALPRSLQELRLEEVKMSCLPQLTALLWCVAEGQLPACKKIHAKEVVGGIERSYSNDHHEIDEGMRVSVTNLRQALDAVADRTVVEVDTYDCQLPREHDSDDMRDLGYDNLIWSPFELFPSIGHVDLRDVNIRAQDFEEMARLCPGLQGIRLAKCEFSRVGMVKWLFDMARLTSLEVNAECDALESHGSTVLVSAMWVAMFGSQGRQVSVYLSCICRDGFYEGPEMDAEVKSVMEKLEHSWQSLSPRRAHGVSFEVIHEIEHVEFF